MALVDVIMPQMGESIAEGTITKWYKKVGEKIGKDETLLEISTDKVDSEIPSPAAGVVAELLFPENETVNVHTVIARIQTDANATVAPAARVSEPQTSNLKPEPVRAKPETVVETRAVDKEDVSAGRFYSPLVLNIARTENVAMSELERIPGTGGNGRVTKNDILRYVQSKKGTSQPTYQPVSATVPQALVPKPTVPSAGVEIIKMDTMRKAIAEHMVRSVHTSAHVSSVTEADVSRIVAYRERHQASFQQREGFKLTYTPFFVEAVVRALKDYSWLNSSVEGDAIIVRKEINIGVAVALENGLIVPVVKHADSKNLVGLARAVNDLSNRARMKKLSPDEVQGGTFTITNPGIFGNLYGAPIINQPQVAILGVGAIKKRPVVIDRDDAIAIRSMVYISMSYDHRIIDGALGGMFLQRVVEYLENFDTNQAL
ncbi:MAG: 2-oxo acid dehydrogenase subunit E2 [Bacteroidota bacterium]|nr:2-oxo acid dehydrogenase subunit E2 [Bacteroidota bacterium]